MYFSSPYDGTQKVRPSWCQDVISNIYNHLERPNASLHLFTNSLQKEIGLVNFSLVPAFTPDLHTLTITRSCDMNNVSVNMDGTTGAEMHWKFPEKETGGITKYT